MINLLVVFWKYTMIMSGGQYAIEAGKLMIMQILPVNNLDVVEVFM
jgi:hypothetical protein